MLLSNGSHSAKWQIERANFETMLDHVPTGVRQQPDSLEEVSEITLNSIVESFPPGDVDNETGEEDDAK